jgi:1-acyl-sn-glycerol-3-phosphate acyltransferase
MYELMRLSGQEYVDLYAADVKEQAEAAEQDTGKPLTGIAAKAG